AARRCDTVEAAVAPDRRRLAVRKVARDTNNDGRYGPEDGEALLIVDLSRGVEGELFPQALRVSGIDWSPREDILVYSALGEGDREDLFRTVPRPAPEESFNLTLSPTVRECRPRIDPTGTVAVYERIEDSGKGQIWLFGSRTAQTRVTSGGPGTDPLPGTPYVVGSDADPDFSPDGRFLVFRRLTGTGNGGLGTWDVMIVRTDATALATLVTGPAYRGAPDWGSQGIVFDEVDLAAGESRLVVIQPDGSGRRVIVTGAASTTLSFPRWLP
ncbi:MAG: TolB family protein, partial [Actinomycetota bacterium]